MKSDELYTINAELKKLGISGDRGELTQAGRDLDIQEVRKRRVDVWQGASLFTVKEASQSRGFAFNFGMTQHITPVFLGKVSPPFRRLQGEEKNQKREVEKMYRD